VSTPGPKTKRRKFDKWPFIRWAEKERAWKVDARTKDGGEPRFFPTRQEAEGWAQVQRIRRQNQGHAAFDDKELALYGWNVQDAIRFALAHLRQQSESKPVSEAMNALLDFKRDRVGETRLSDIENRLLKFCSACEGKTVAQITDEDINAFLSSIPHPATRNDYRKEIVMLWHFCRSKKWVSESLDKTQVPRHPEPEKRRTILTIEQTVHLMEASIDPEICALNAMILFGGIRREEAEKLDWSAVNFKTGHIEISAEVSKVARERFAPMPDNLRDWLLPLAKKEGPIVSRNLMHALRKTWKRARLYPWPQDAHRHSFISYRRRLIGDAQTALDAGTSETIIKKHYKRPVTLEDAQQYFDIRPASEDAGKIVALNRA
jgi:integrase